MKLMIWLKKNVFPLLITLVCIVYITRGLATLVESGRTVLEIVANGILAAITGWTISILWGELGIQEELVTDEFIAIKAEKLKIVDLITPQIGMLHRFCEIKNGLVFEREQTRILRKVGLSMKDYKLGIYDKKDKEVMKAIKEARHSYKEYYTFDGLLSNAEVDESGQPKRASLSQYRVKTNSKKILSSLLSGVIFGYFTLVFVDGLDWANLIWYALQVVLFNLMGFVQYIVNKSYVSQTIGTQFKTDTNALHEFHNSLTEHPDWYAEEKQTTPDKPKEKKAKVVENADIQKAN